MTSTYVSLQLFTQNLPRSLSITASQPDVARDVKYYQDNIGKITSVDQFLGDKRLFSIAMKANGMEDMTFATAFMRKVLESDLSDPKSFANKLSDTRYVAFAKQFNFGTTGNVPTGLTYAQDDSHLADTETLYSQHRVQQGVAASTEAQYYQSKIPTLTSVDGLIADPRLFAYALTAAGIDPTIASESTIRDVLTSDLSDPNSRLLYEKTLSNIQEVKAREGKVIAVVCEGDEEVGKVADHVIPIASTHELLLPILEVVPLQMLAYHIAVRRGCDVDQPRNLAKSVTVE